MPKEITGPAGANVGTDAEVRVSTQALQVTISWWKLGIIVGAVVGVCVPAYMWFNGRFDGLTEAIAAVADRVTYIEGLLEVRTGTADQ